MKTIVCACTIPLFGLILFSCGPAEEKDPVAAAIRKLGEGNFLSRRAAAKDLAEKAGKEDTAAVPVLLEAFQDSDLEIRRYAAKALKNIADPRAVPVLVEGVADENSYIRYDAVVALGSFNLPRSREAVLGALNDESSYVRYAAVESIGKLKIKEAFPRLIAAMDDGSSYVRCAAAESLGALGDKQAVPHLERGLTSRNLWVRNSAALGLARLGNSTGIPVLIENLASEAGDERGTVRAQADECLREITGQDFSFDPDAAPGARRKSIEKWEEWWKSQRSDNS